MNTTDALLMAAFGGKKTVIIPRKAINLLDIKGNVFKAYEKAEFLRLTELPAPPSADGMKPKGWNWTLPEAKAAVEANGTLDVAPQYETSDGKTRIYITLYEGRLSPTLGICPNGTVTVDWGDGSATEEVTGTSTTTLVSTTHTYPAPGDYVITLDVDGTMYFYSDESGSKLLYGKSAYLKAITKIEVGKNIPRISDYAFTECRNLKSVVLSEGVTHIGKRFCDNTALENITLPNGLTNIGIYAFDGCPNLDSLSLPNTVTSIGNNAFAGSGIRHISFPPRPYTNTSTSGWGSVTCENCLRLATVSLSSNAKLIPQSMFNKCSGLTNVTIPAAVMRIDQSAFIQCSSLARIRFEPTTPPTVPNAAFGLPADCIIEVPYAGLASYLSASNYPKKTTYTYLGYATYTSGAALPAQDGTEAYNVTWYATRADAKAGTNPITEGNGNEIYCTYAAVTA